MLRGPVETANLELAIATANYIENFYNPAGRRSTLNDLSRTEFEDLHSTQIRQSERHNRSPPKWVEPTWHPNGIRTSDPHLGRVGRIVL